MLTPRERSVLRAMLQAHESGPGWLGLTNVATSAGLSLEETATALAKPVQLGYVEQRGTRGAIYQLTDEGRRIAGTAISVPVWEMELAAGMSAQESVEVVLPERAYQVTVRFFTVSGHQFRDVALLTDDYLRRKEDGSLNAYLETHVIPRLKRQWYPFPVDSGDRWVLPVLLVDGVYVPDDDAPNPLDSYSVSFADPASSPAGLEFPTAPSTVPPATPGGRRSPKPPPATGPSPKASR